MNNTKGIDMLRVIAIVLCILAAAPAAVCADAGPGPGTARYTVITGGKRVGMLTATSKGEETRIDFDVKDNGRGPTIAETIRFDSDALPTQWTITGTTTFGSKVSEHFARKGAQANWTDSTGKGSATIGAPSLYVAQSGSPWSDGLYARALLRSADRKLAALPGGTLALEAGETLTVQGEAGPVTVTRYELSGINLTPDTILLDANGALFASVDPSVILVRAGYEGEEARLRKLAADWVTQRYVKIQQESAHSYSG